MTAIWDVITSEAKQSRRLQARCRLSGRTTGRRFLAVGMAFGEFCMYAAPAGAHGFGQRYDLPLPLSLYLFGAGAAVILSFIVVGLCVRHPAGVRGYPRIDLTTGCLGRWLIHP